MKKWVMMSVMLSLVAFTGAVSVGADDLTLAGRYEGEVRHPSGDSRTITVVMAVENGALAVREYKRGPSGGGGQKSRTMKGPESEENVKVAVDGKNVTFTFKKGGTATFEKTANGNLERVGGRFSGTLKKK